MRLSVGGGEEGEQAQTREKQGESVPRPGAGVLERRPGNVGPCRELTWSPNPGLSQQGPAFCLLDGTRELPGLPAALELIGTRPAAAPAPTAQAVGPVSLLTPGGRGLASFSRDLQHRAVEPGSCCF